MNVIELFRNDLWNGIWQHTKQLLKPMLTPTAIAVVLSGGIFYIAYLIIKPLMPPEVFESGGITDMEQVSEMIVQVSEAILENQVAFMAKMFGVTILFALVGSWYYNVALIISKQVVESDEESIQPSMADSFGISFRRVLGYGIIMALVSTAVSALNSSLQTFMPGIAFLVNLLLQVLVLRLFAGRAWIVLGDQNVKDGFKLSWENITFVRALKLFLIFIVGFIAIGLVLGLVFGLSMFAGAVGAFVFMLALMIVGYVISVVGVAGLSASFYRYVEVEYEGTNQAVDHIIDTEE